MKMKTILSGLILMFIICTYPAYGSPQIVIGLVPDRDPSIPGGSFYIDITISGLQSGGVDNLLGGWTLNVNYNEQMVTPDWEGTKIGNKLGNSNFNGLNASVSYKNGMVNLTEVSMLSLSDLDQLQRDGSGNLLDGFVLAQLFFSVRGYGEASIIVDNIDLSDGWGYLIYDASGKPIDTQGGKITVSVVDEPPILALLIIGLIGLRASKRNQKYPQITK